MIVVINSYMRNGAGGGLPVVHAFTQSNVYTGLVAASIANMLDDNTGGSTTGTGCDGANNYVRMELASAVNISGCIVGGGSISGWGQVAPYLNGAVIQTSLNGTGWTTVATVSGVADSGASRNVTFTWATAPAKFIRVFRAAAYLSVAHFSPLP